MPPESLEHRLRQAETYLAIEQVLRSVKQRMEQRFTSEGLSDVTPQQAKVLMLLFQEKRAVTGQFLSEKLAISAVTVSRFLRSLEENHWVERERDPKDARASLIRPTSKAYESLPQFIRISNELMDEVFGHLPPEEFRRFAASVKQVQDELQARNSTEP
jgi:DNA-binding MarR family transcriptional regulator